MGMRWIPTFEWMTPYRIVGFPTEERRDNIGSLPIASQTTFQISKFATCHFLGKVPADPLPYRPTRSQLLNG
jgi:hypothetical protein